VKEKPLWGPWSPDCSPRDQALMLRSLATLCHVMRLPGQMNPNDLVYYLREGEFSALAREKARKMFDLLPSLLQRQIIASFSAVNVEKLSAPALVPEAEEVTEDNWLTIT
jgi:hypothetical protein